MSHLAPTMQAFFTDRLIRERDSSPNTIAAYRDTMRLLLTFASERLGVEPCQLNTAELDAPLIGAFLDHLEHAAMIERVLAIPPKRHGKTLITFLTKDETDALIAAVDISTWTGRRDRAMLMLAAQTGLRASELVGLTIADVHLGSGAHVNCIGKRRKQRITPLTTTTTGMLRAWLSERGGDLGDPLFPTSQGGPLSTTRSSNAWPNTPRPPPSCARRYTARRSRPACAGTRRRCGY
jgi:integrase/recombinase XerD